MIINKLFYKIYGKLIDKEIELSPGITVFLGDNEAGKSTIFNSLVTLIYGFKPSSRDKHPYSNWLRNEINFSSEITELGELFMVERSLKSVPKFYLTKDKTQSTQTYRNETLPFINHVSDALFEAVFHLTADDLNQFEKASFESVQEKLIFNYGSDYLNKASDVILQLEQDINALWRKDKRGNPKINQLQNEINALKLQRHDAEKDYEKIQNYLLKIESIEKERIRLLSEKNTLDQSQRQMRTVLPIKALIVKIEALKQNIYKEDAFSEFEGAFIDQMNQTQIKVNDMKSKIERDMHACTQLKHHLFVYSDHDIKLLNFKSEVEPLKNALNELVSIEQEAHSKLDERMKLLEKISGQYKILFDSEINDTIKTQLKKLQVLDLMTHVQKYTDGVDKNEEALKAEKIVRNHKKKETVFGGLLGGIALVLGMVYEQIWFLSFLGIGIIGFTLAHIKSLRSKRNTECVDLTALTEKIEALSGPIVFPEYVLRDRSLRFFGKLEQLIMLIYEEDTLYEKWVSLNERQKVIETTISTVLVDKKFEPSRGAALSLQYILAQMERLSEIEGIETKKNLEIEHLQNVIQSDRKACTALENNLIDLKAKIKNFGQGDYDFGLNRITHNLELTRTIKVYEDELSTIQFDRDAVLEASETVLSGIETRITEIHALEKQLLSEKMQYTSEIERYNDLTNLEAINSQLLVAEEQMNEWMENRNQLMVLLEIIKSSDERYRIENQPNIITRVSHFMNQMTQGKYKEVLISEDNGNFELQCVIDGEIIPFAKAFSKGTIQQLFFAYRLAILEALDPQNQLPFVLDEAFVNWDSNRYLETLKILEDVSKKRQIIMFTCHRNLAKQVVEHTPSKLIELAV